MNAFFLLSHILAVYYTLIMYLADTIMAIPYFAPGFLFLELMLVLYGLADTYQPERKGIIVCCALVPALSFAMRPSLLQALMILPVWVMLVVRMVRTDYDMDYGHYRMQCSRILIIEFIVAVSLFFMPRWAGALVSAIPYFVIQMCFMVCTLRWLRQERTGGLSSLAMTGTVSAVSLLCALTGFLSRLGHAIGELYIYLVSKMIGAVMPDQLPQFENIELPDAVLVDTGADAMPSQGYHEPALIAALKQMSLFEKILIIAVIVVIVLAVILALFYFMRGHRYYRRPQKGDISERIEGRKKNRMPVFAPSDRREAVRWYYARYLKECRRRGIMITPQMNSEQVAAADSLLDPQSRETFRSLYIRCRYSSKDVSSEDVKLAKSLYRSAKAASGS